MTELEVEFMERLLTLLKDQRSKLGEMISSIEEVLKYEGKIHVSMPETRIREKE